MKTRGIIIKRTKRVLDKDGKEVFKPEFLRCRVNAAVTNDHPMIKSERF